MERKFKVLQPIHILYYYYESNFSRIETKELKYEVGDILDKKQYQELIGMRYNDYCEILPSTNEMMIDSLVDCIKEISIGDELLKKILKATKEGELYDGGLWYDEYSLATYGCNDQSPRDFMKITKEESDYLATLEEEI